MSPFTWQPAVEVEVVKNSEKVVILIRRRGLEFF
jgi:hypothetical protein